MIKTFVFEIVVCCLFCSCQTTKQEVVDNGSLNVIWPPENPGSIAEIIDSLEYISLEVSDSSLFGHIMVCCYTPEKFFILGNESERNIKVFDSSGKYLNRIGNYGRGPGEYVNMFDWSVKGDTVYVGDLIQNKILLYRDNGQLIQEMSLPADFRSAFGGLNALGIYVRPLDQGGYFTKLIGNVLAGYAEERNDIIFLDQDLQVKPLPAASVADQSEHHHLFAFNNWQSDSICIANGKGEIIAVVHIDFGKNRVTPEIRKSLTFSEIQSTKSFIATSLLAGDYVLLDIMHAGRRVRGIVNWKNGKVYLNDDKGDNRHKILNFAAASADEQSVVSFISTSRSVGFDELPADLQKGLEEDGGAVLVKYRLKS